MLVLSLLSRSLASEDTDEHENVFVPHVVSSELSALFLVLLPK